MNEPRNEGRSVTVGLPGFELISYRGETFGPYSTIAEAREAALMKWPDQSQDEDRTGAGWDIQVAGAK